MLLGYLCLLQVVQPDFGAEHFPVPQRKCGVLASVHRPSRRWSAPIHGIPEPMDTRFHSALHGGSCGTLGET